MKKNKINDKYISDEAKEIRRFAFILIGIIVVVLIVYGVGRYFKNDEQDKYARTYEAGSLDYSVVSVGTMFNKLSELGSKMIIDFLPKFIKGDINPIKQKENEVTYAYNITKEDYVFLYSSDDNSAVLYSNLISTQKSKKDGLAIYYCDITSKLNENYYSSEGKSNTNAKTIEDVKFGPLTLVKIKNGKIVKYLEKIEDIKKELS